MKKLKLGFTDTFGTAIDFWIWVLSKRYEVIRDDENCELLIFGDGNFGQTHTKYLCKKLFYTGENVRPDYSQCDYACTFDHINSPIHYRLPLYVLEMHAMTKEGYDFYYLLNKKIDDPEKLYDRGFCSFVQSNPNVTVRNNFFHCLSDRQRVDSGGPLYNNIGYVLDRPGGHKDKLNFLKDRKFNIAFENGDYPGYVTEKLLNAFYANTIPIYWGSELVGRDFNSKAFINSNDFYNQIELRDHVFQVERDKNKYLDILTQPAFHDNMLNEYCNLNNLLDWFDQNVMEK